MSLQSLKEKCSGEGKKLRELTFRQKLTYIWDYYKWAFVVIAALIGLGAAIAEAVGNMRIETVFQAQMLNCNLMVSEDSETVGSGFAAYIGGLEENQVVEVGCSLNIYPDMLDNYTMANQVKLMALTSAGDLDVIVIPESLFDYYLNQKLFADLTEILDEDELEQWDERLVIGEQNFGDDKEEDWVKGTYALDLTGTGLLERTQLYSGCEEKIYAGIICNTGRTELAVKFLHYLMEE